MREMLSAVGLARAALARRLRMSVHDVEVMELLMLSAPDADLGPVELSRQLGVSSAAATQSVTRLEDAGHLARAPHPTDRRRRVLRVTPSGREHVLRALGPMLALLADQSGRFPDGDRDAVTRYLHAQTAAYRAFLAPERPAGTP